MPQVQINMNRHAAAAVGLRAADLAETVDTAFNGEEVSQVLEEQKTYEVVVRLMIPRANRSNQFVLGP